MSNSKLFSLVARISVLSLLVPLLVSGSAGKNGVAASKLQKYLNIADSSINADQGLHITEVKDGSPSNYQESPQLTPTTSKEDSSKTSVEDSSKSASSYVVKDGDTYGCIAEKHYGSFEHYVDIMTANGAGVVPGYSDYQLNVDAPLVLPAIDAANLKPATHLCQ